MFLASAAAFFAAIIAHTSSDTCTCKWQVGDMGSELRVKVTPNY